MKHFLIASAIVFCFGSSAALSAGQGSDGSLTADDYVEIQQLYAHYAHALDLGDAQAWADTFTPDGVFLDAKGREELVAFAKGFEENFAGYARHWNSQVLITTTANGADGSCYLLLVDTSVQPVGISVSGIYEDKIVKTAAGWRFQKRVAAIERPVTGGQ